MRGPLGQVPGEVAQQVSIDNGDEDIRRFMAKRRDFYVYEARTTAGTPIAAGITQTDAIPIEADSNFILEKLAYFADIAAAAQTQSTQVLPLVTIQIQDTGSGRNLMANPIPIPSIFGFGYLPFVLPKPRIFMRNTTIQITFTNFSAATSYNVQLAFIGYKVYSTV
jgi:hypothetical protein